MFKVLVIGYGNPLRGDDGAGPAVGEEIRRRAGSSPALRVLTPHQLTPELAEDISRAGLVIFVDASAGGEPGITSRQQVRPAPSTAAFSHQVTPATLLHAVQVLYGPAPQAFLYSIYGEDFNFRERLTARVCAAVDRVCAEIESDVRRAESGAHS